MAATKKIIIFEIDKPVDFTTSMLVDNAELLPYLPGLWYFFVSPGNVTFTDNHSVTVYYKWTNSTLYNLKSLKVDGADYLAVFNLSDLYITDSSFYYDTATTKLYIHFSNFEPPLDKNIVLGNAYGYTWGDISNTYMLNTYYEQRIKTLFPIKKSIDPLFWGLLKFQSNKIAL